MKRGKLVDVYVPKAFKGGKWYHEGFVAKVLGVIDGYAMLRRPRAAPFVQSVKQLEKWQWNPPLTMDEMP